MYVINAKELEKITVLDNVLYYAKNSTDDEVVVDFSKCEKYENLFGEKLLKIYDNEKVKKVIFLDTKNNRTSVKVMESIYGKKLDKTEFVEKEKKVCVLDKKRSAFYDKVSELAQKNDKTLIIDLRSLQGACRYNNIEAIAKYVEDNQEDVSNVIIIGSESFIISDAQSKELAKMVKVLGIKAEFVGFDSAEKIFEVNIKTKGKDETERQNREILKIGTVGILKCYQNSKALDDYGRRGHGEVKFTMYAEVESIIDGKVTFKLYKSDIFKGYMEYFIESGQSLIVDCTRFKLDIKNIGINNEYYGENAQFYTVDYINLNGKERNWVEVNENNEVVGKPIAQGTWIERVIEDWKEKGIYV